MPKLVQLPTYLSVRSATDSIVACQALLAEADDIAVDASHLCFVDPFGLAMLGATFQMLRDNGRAVEIRNLSAVMASYLQRMDLFAGANLVGIVPSNDRRNNRSDALVELTRLNQASQVEATAARVAQSLVGRIPGMNPDEAPDEMTGYSHFDRVMEPIQYALNELLENALTHARRQGCRDASVWVASQYYPSNGLIRLGVVDNGCGFLATLRTHPELSHATDHAAILLALKPRISCNRDLRAGLESVNQGVGLTTTCRIAEQAGGRLVVVSGSAVHGTQGHSGELGSSARWQGVAVALECRRARLPEIKFRELLPSYESQTEITLRFE